MNIKTRIALMIVVPMILTASVVAVFAVAGIRATGAAAIDRLRDFHQDHISQMESEGRRRIEAYREELLARKKEYLKSQVQTAMSVLEKGYQDAHDPEKLQNVYRQRLKNVVDTAYGVLEAMAEKEDLPEPERRARAAGLIKTLRYGPENKDYFWINDTHPTMVMHPYKPELDGTDLTGYQDPNGKHLFVAFVRVCRENGEGFVDYDWPKYGAEKPQPKLSFVKLFRPWNWIIGSGVYLEIAEERLKADSAEIIAALRYGPENKDYFWINDMHPTMVMHPYKPELDGTDLAGYQDPNGKHLFVEFVRVCRENGGGFVEYFWPKYGADEPQPKLSYVEVFEPWNWIIGTGLYIDDIRTLIRSRELELKHQLSLSAESVEARIEAIGSGIRDRVRSVMGRILLITLGILLATLVIAAVLTRGSIIRPVRQVIGGLTQVSQQVSAASSQIAAGSQLMAESASRQAASVEESSASLEEMSAMSNQTSAMTKGAEELMIDNIEKSGRSLKSLMELSQDMAEIETESDKISGIIKVVNDIAFRTTLLSLNAAVEAARAGEAGTGFAVVADEVKNLAKGTIDAADNTQELLTQTLEKVTRAARAIKGISEDFTAIIESATIMGEKTATITQASKEQSRGIQQVTQAAFEIDKVTQQIAANAEESAAAAQDLSGQAHMMERHVASLVRLVGAETDRRGASRKKKALASGK